MNLVPLPFGFFEAGRQNNAAAGGMRFVGMRRSSFVGHLENGSKHFDDVLKRVLLVIQNDDVVQLAELIFGGVFGIRV